MPDGSAFLFPTMATSVPVPEPETEYTGLLIWLSLSPRIDQGAVDAAMNLTTRPYRILKDGTVDVAPDSLVQTWSVGASAEVFAAKDDMSVRLADALAKIESMLQDLFGDAPAGNLSIAPPISIKPGPIGIIKE
jgi:hypothetical protein